MKRKIIAGLMATIFLMTMGFAVFPVQVSAQQGEPIKIGIVGPKGWIQWAGIKEGAELARDLINDAGGMKDSEGKTHELKIVEIDEHAVPVPDPIVAVQELLTALDDNPSMQFLIGGYRVECVLPLRKAAMDYAAVHDRPIWIIAGATWDELIDDGPEKDNPYDDVREDYERYKYMFRSGSMNWSTAGSQLGLMLAQFSVPKLKAIYGIPPEDLLPTYIIGEIGIWIDKIVERFCENAYFLGIDIVGVGRPSIIETYFAPFLDAIEESGAKLIIHIFSTVASRYFITQWREMKVPAVPVGINVESQMQEFWAETGGLCEYETILGCVGTRINMNPDAKPLSTVEFWDAYEAMFGHSPIYTAWGAYDTIIALNETATQWIGQPCSWIIPNVMEPIERSGLLGYFKYTKYHDVYCDAFSATPIWPSHGAPPNVPGEPGTVRAHILQWQDGRLEVVWPRGYWIAPGGSGPSPDPTPLPFARKWKIPPWMYELAETDFAGGPPIPSPTPALAELAGVPAGFFGYFTSPDGTVGAHDMATVTGLWQQTCAWNVLEADIDGNNFIDIVDVLKVALDWGGTATPQDP